MKWDRIAKWWMRFWLVFMVVFMAIIMVCAMAESEDKKVCKQDYADGYATGYAYIKSVKELQKQVGMEPNNIDGKICKGWNIKGHSKTIEAYNRAYCDQEAVAMFERMAGK